MELTSMYLQEQQNIEMHRYDVTKVTLDKFKTLMSPISQ